MANDLVRLDKVEFSDDEDNTFQYAIVDDDVELEGENDDDEEDFAAVLRNLNKSSITNPTTSNNTKYSYPSPNKEKTGNQSCFLNTSPGAISPTTSPSRKIQTQVRPAVVDDFIRNFLIKLGMTKTLDMFNQEWYEFISRGKLLEDDIGVVPDIYVRNLMLDDQIKELRRQLEVTQKVAEKAKGTWDKFRQQRDIHKMHHQRVLHEKDALRAKILRLEKHLSNYEPLLQELKGKYEAAMKEKMLMRLEKDRHAARAEALENQMKVTSINDIEINNQTAKSCKSSRKKQYKVRGEDNTAPYGSYTSQDMESKSPQSLNSIDTRMKTTNNSRIRTKGSVESKNLPQDDMNPHQNQRVEPFRADGIELKKTCRGHGNSIAAIAFHPKNPILATASDDSLWKLWAVPSCELVMSGEGHSNWLSGIVFHPQGTHVASTSGDNTIKIWDFVSASCSLTLSDHAHPVWESAFHHGGNFLVSASMDHTCKLWDINTGKCRKTLRGHVDSVNSVCFQPFTANICTGSGDKTVSLWDLRSGLCVQTFYGHQNACNSVAFALQGETIASCDADGFVKVWDVRMVLERATLDGGQHSLNSITFDPSGQVLASASDDHTIKLFRLDKENATVELKGHDGPVQSVQFENRGRYLASSSSDCTYRIWSH